MKSFFKIILLISTCNVNAKAQSLKKKFVYGAEFQFVLNGLIKTSFNTYLYGANVKYNIKDFKNIGLNVSQGFSTDLSSRESRFIALNTQLGVDFFKKKRISPFIGLGGYFTNERLSIAIIEGTDARTFNRFGLAGTAGIRFRNTKHFSPVIFARSFLNTYNSVGVALNYKF